MSVRVLARPDAARTEFAFGELVPGFRELAPGEFLLAGEHWQLEIDDELIEREDHHGQSRWSWTPGFYAGEVRARFVDQRGGAEHELRLDVSPAPDKLGRLRYAALLEDLRRELPEYILGSEPATLRAGTGGHLADPLLAYARLRAHAHDYIESLCRVVARPVRRLRAERRMLALSHIRKADRRTVFHALCSAEIAPTLRGQEPSVNSHRPPRLDAPVVDLHVDEAANRCIKAQALTVLRSVVDCREQLAKRVEREQEGGARTTLSPRWPVRERFLRGIEIRLLRVLRGPVLSAVSRARTSGGGLNTIAAHPVYSRAFKLGWRALGRGFTGDRDDIDLWLPPTWEVYERWCFVALRRLLRESFGFDEISERSGPRAELVWRGIDRDRRRVWVGFQAPFTTWSSSKTHECRSLSVTRYPDLVLMVENARAIRWIVLDAKYRVSRPNVLDAMTSAHLYHDALRWRGARPDRSLLLVPASGGAPWLEDPAFHADHGVGVVEAAPSRLEKLSQALEIVLR